MHTKPYKYLENTIMSIDPKNLNELKNALLSKKSELEENLGRIAKPIDQKTGEYETSFDEVGTDRDDNTTEVEEYADNLPVEITLEQKLHDVMEALKKIDEGTYGICEKCGKEIAIERLRVNPSAKTCTNCSN